MYYAVSQGMISMPAFQMNKRKPYKPEAKWDDSIPPNWPLLPLMVPPFLSPVSLPALKDRPHTTWYSHLTACITYLGMIPWGFQLYRETTPPFSKKALWDTRDCLLTNGVILHLLLNLSEAEFPSVGKGGYIPQQASLVGALEKDWGRTSTR